MFISKVEIANFVGIQGPVSVEIDSPDHSLTVCGRNGCGKTSFLKALCYGLTGLTLDGVRTSSYKKPGSDTLSVKITFDNGDELLRRRTDSTMFFTKNGVNVDFPFGNVDLFHLMLNPMSLFTMKEADSRKVFMLLAEKATVQVDRLSIIRERWPNCLHVWQESVPSKDQYTAALQAIRFNQDRSSALDHSLAKLKNGVDTLRANVSMIANEPAELPTEIVDVDQINKKIQALTQEKTSLQQKISRLEKEVSIEHLCTEENRARYAAISQADELAKKMQEITNRIAVLTPTIERTHSEGKILSEKVNAAQSNTCPTCKQPWVRDTGSVQSDQARLQDLRAAYTRAQKEKVAAEEELAALRKTQADHLMAAKELKLALQKHGVTAEAVFAEKDPFSENPEEKLKEFQDAVAAISDEILNLSSSLHKAVEQKSLLASIVRAKRIQEDLEKAEADLNNSAGEILRQKEACQSAIALNTLLAEATHPKTGVDAVSLEASIDAIAGVFPDYEFRFERTLKNGKTEDCFEVHRKSDGVDISSLSSGEQRKFALDLATLVARITQTQLPMTLVHDANLCSFDFAPYSQNLQLFSERVTDSCELSFQQGVPPCSSL